MVSGSAGPLWRRHHRSATGGDGGSPVTASTVSLTSGKVGTFVVRNLPTPGTYTVVVTAPGLQGAGALSALTVSGAAVREGYLIDLASGSGTIAGKGHGCQGRSPAGSVRVVPSAGPLSITTATLSEGKRGPWCRGHSRCRVYLAPANYEVTFSRPDLVAASREVQLLPGATSDPAPGDPASVDPAPGDPASGDQAPGPAPSRSGPLDVTMVLATADIYGRVADQRVKPLAGIGIYLASSRSAPRYAVTCRRPSGSRGLRE